jgi:hypothetical protein
MEEEIDMMAHPLDADLKVDREPVHDLRGTYASLGVSAGAPVYHVTESIGHSETYTTEKLYANLAPGAARGFPNILERFVRNAKVQNATHRRTE